MHCGFRPGCLRLCSPALFTLLTLCETVLSSSVFLCIISFEFSAAACCRHAERAPGSLCLGELFAHSLQRAPSLSPLPGPARAAAPRCWRQGGAGREELAPDEVTALEGAVSGVLCRTSPCQPRVSRWGKAQPSTLAPPATEKTADRTFQSPVPLQRSFSRAGAFTLPQIRCIPNTPRLPPTYPAQGLFSNSLSVTLSEQLRRELADGSGGAAGWGTAVSSWR